MSIETPEPVVKEGMDEKSSLERALSEIKLAEIIDKCEEYLHATMKCPWECTVYFHKMGYIPFDLMYETAFSWCHIPVT